MLWALLNLGGIFENRLWAFASELLRLPVTAILLAAKVPAGAWLTFTRAGLAVAVVVSVAFPALLSPQERRGRSSIRSDRRCFDNCGGHVLRQLDGEVRRD